MLLNNTPSYNIVNNIRKVDQIGGGICIGIDNNITYRNLTHLIPESITKEIEIIFLQVINSDFELYITNVYINNFQKKKKHLKQLNEWLINNSIRKPEALHIVVGDFNCNSQPITHWLNLNLQNQPTFKRVVKGVTR